MGVRKILQAPKPTPIQEVIAHSSPFVGLRATAKGKGSDFIHIEGWDSTHRSNSHPNGQRSQNGDGYLHVNDVEDFIDALRKLAAEVSKRG